MLYRFLFPETIEEMNSLKGTSLSRKLHYLYRKKINKIELLCARARARVCVCVCVYIYIYIYIDLSIYFSLRN